MKVDNNWIFDNDNIFINPKASKSEFSISVNYEIFKTLSVGTK